MVYAPMQCLDELHGMTWSSLVAMGHALRASDACRVPFDPVKVGWGKKAAAIMRHVVLNVNVTPCLLHELGGCLWQHKKSNTCLFALFSKVCKWHLPLCSVQQGVRDTLEEINPSLPKYAAYKAPFVQALGMACYCRPPGSAMQTVCP